MGLLVLALLAAYWSSFIMVWRNGFAAAGWIRANKIMAVLLLVPAPIVLAGVYYFFIMDWPMNIGGKPNHTLYHNIPTYTVEPMVVNVISWLGVASWMAVFPSWLYLMWRVRKTKRPTPA